MSQSRSTAKRAWMGVDLGTQSVRAVLVDDLGTVLGSGSTALHSRREPHGRHEQDPESWWRAVTSASRQAMAGNENVAVRGLACCGTSGTILLTEPSGDDPAAPVTPALMYDDSRAAAEADRVLAHPAPQWIAAGLSPQRSWALPKLLWLLRDGSPSPTARLTHQVDFVNSRLVGHPVATDSSNSLKSGIDPVSGDWPLDTMQLLGVDPGLLPPVARPGAILGTVSSQAAEATGIPAGTPVTAGMTDGCAAQIAAGVLRAGQWNFVVGTTIVLKGVSDSLLRDPSGALYSHYSPDGRWWPGGASSAGAGALAAEFAPADFPRLEALASQREPAGSITYPLNGVGERFPFRRPDAHRLTLGAGTDEADRYAAVLQGVGFVQRLCLDHVRRLGATVGDQVTVTGGATRSTYWPQLQADILGLDVRVPAVAEGAIGMAVLAASRVDSLPAAAARMLGTATVYHPRPEVRQRFAEPYARLASALLESGWIDADLAATAMTEGRS